MVYDYDYYVLPPDAKAYLGDNYASYKRLVDAVLAREEKVNFENQPMVPALSCLYAEFPLSILLCDYQFDEKENVLALSYAYDPAEHAARIKAFQERVEDVIRSTIKPHYNECELALALYRWTAQNIVYVDDVDVSPYNAIMNGRGICQSYDGVYRFLLLQAGVDALSGGSFMTDGAAHAWNLVKLDGSWFHMDATFESSDNGGEGLRYFGMADAHRLQTGTISPFGTGIDGYNAPAPPCDDFRFSALAAATRWEFSRNTHRIILYYEGSSQPSAVFNTVTYNTLDYRLP